ncbi:MAG: DUF4037 domain-containing protein [Chloroflexota bacterium]
MPKFIPGLKLSELFYQEVVQPILDQHFPNLVYSAGLIGYGSDVIGFDTPISTDHMWGPRLNLILQEEDYATLQRRILDTMRQELPYEFKGYSVNFSDPDPNDGGIRHQEMITSGLVDPLLGIFTIKSFFGPLLDWHPPQSIDVADWLTFSEHCLLTITAGGIFHDDLDIEDARQKLAYYPNDVWRFMMASQWTKISQEEAFVGRCGDVGDELGSQIIATRIVHSLMRLCFMMAKQYAPYSKWFGSAFARLPIAERLQPSLTETLQAKTWKQREAGLIKAYQIVAETHNDLQITEPVSPDITDYYGRPYQVLFAGRFADALWHSITDPQVKQIKGPIGSVTPAIRLDRRV